MSRGIPTGYMPGKIFELAQMTQADRDAATVKLGHLIEGDRIHFPLEDHERITGRDRKVRIAEFADEVRRHNTRLLAKHTLPHLLIPERDEDNDDVYGALEALQAPGDGSPLAVLLSGPNSTGKSLLAAWTGLRLLRSQFKIESTEKELRTVVMYGVSRPAPVFVYNGRALRATYESQRIVSPRLDDIVFLRDPDLLRDIQRSYNDDEAPSEADQISALARRKVVVIEDLGWRHGGKPDFPRRVWSDFLDQREATSGTVTIISTNLSSTEEVIDHIDMRGWERLAGMLRKNGGWFDVRGRSRRLTG